MKITQLHICKPLRDFFIPDVDQGNFRSYFTHIIIDAPGAEKLLARYRANAEI
jgi:hypothetical protein